MKLNPGSRWRLAAIAATVATSMAALLSAPAQAAGLPTGSPIPLTFNEAQRGITAALGMVLEVRLQEGPASGTYFSSVAANANLLQTSVNRIPGTTPGTDTYVARYLAQGIGASQIIVSNSGAAFSGVCVGIALPSPAAGPVTCFTYRVQIVSGSVPAPTPPAPAQLTAADGGFTLAVPKGTTVQLQLFDLLNLRWGAAPQSLDPSVLAFESATTVPSPCPFLPPPPKVNPQAILSTPPASLSCEHIYSFLAAGPGTANLVAEGQALCGPAPPPGDPYYCRGPVITFTVVVLGSCVPGPSSTPLSVSAVPGPGSGQATVSWLPPADSGCSPVTFYAIYTYPQQNAPFIISSASPQAVSGLAGHNFYVFTISAWNGRAWSAWSQWSNWVWVP